MDEQLNKETYNQWLGHPATKQVLKKVEEEAKRVAMSMAKGATLCGNEQATTADATLEKTAKNVGLCKGLFFAFTIDFSKAKDDENGAKARSEQRPVSA